MRHEHEPSDCRENGLRIPMRGYEFTGRTAVQRAMMRYESPCGVMRRPLIPSVLRIPCYESPCGVMREDAKKVLESAKPVTNPHAGL